MFSRAINNRAALISECDKVHVYIYIYRTGSLLRNNSSTQHWLCCIEWTEMKADPAQSHYTCLQREPSAKAHRDLIVFQDVLHWPLSGNSESIYRCFRKVFSELIMLTDRYCPNSMKVFISNTILFQTQKNINLNMTTFHLTLGKSSTSLI